jgi:hypothetical protein
MVCCADVPFFMERCADVPFFMRCCVDVPFFMRCCADVPFLVAKLQSALIFPDRNETGIRLWVNKDAVYVFFLYQPHSFLRVSSFLDLEKTEFYTSESGIILQHPVALRVLNRHS